MEEGKQYWVSYWGNPEPINEAFGEDLVAAFQINANEIWRRDEWNAKYPGALLKNVAPCWVAYIGEPMTP